MKKFSVGHWIFLVVLALLLLVLLGYNFYLLALLQVYKVFLPILGAAILLLIVITCIQIFAFKRTIHLHHYQIGAIFYFFTPFQNVISAICQSIAAGSSAS